MYCKTPALSYTAYTPAAAGAPATAPSAIRSDSTSGSVATAVLVLAAHTHSAGPARLQGLRRARCTVSFVTQLEAGELHLYKSTLLSR